jgi:hypothetical protein
MDPSRLLAVVILAALIAWIYRNLPQNLGRLSQRWAGLSPSFRDSYRGRLERELAAYRSALADPFAFQTQATHLQALLILSAAMTLLAVILFVAALLLESSAKGWLAAWFPPVELALALFFLVSIVGLRLAVFRSWIFLHSDRNLRRLERSIAALSDRSKEQPA